MKYDCLIVDDEEALAQSTCEYFNLFEVKSYWTASAAGCLNFLQQNETTLILLDINLGNASGFELCKRLRQTTQIPILFISARTSDDDQILALNIGGDDYIQKPYSLSVLLAKVKAVLKRCRNDAPAPTPQFCSDGLCINFELGRVTLNGKVIPLKSMEYKLLAYLVQHRGRTVTKQELFREVWGDAITGDGTLNVHIRRLREKIEENPTEPRRIRTVWGTGYVFEETTL